MDADTQVRIACDVKDLALAESGKRRTEWAFQSMPVLQSVRKQFIPSQPFKNVRIAARLHVTPETANLIVTLRDGGASVVLCAADPNTIQDDVAASLVKDYGVSVFAIRGESGDTIQQHLTAAADHVPQIAMDAGAGLIAFLHTHRQEMTESVLGATEETSSGIVRVRSMSRDSVLKFPVVAVNSATTKLLFDNRYGTGQSTVDAILRATNLLLAGMTFVVAGYGWAGKGIAFCARGHGANVVVTEIDPVKAVEAVLDGFRVMSMTEASAIGDIFVTVTGNKLVMRREHLEKLKNGAVLCNAGHSNVEIDLENLVKMTSARRSTREFVEEMAFRDGRRVSLLAEGRPVNMTAGEGHPAAVMDVSFANQALSVEWILRSHSTLEGKVYPVPDEIDKQVARMKLESLGVKLDRLTPDQEAYLGNWQGE